MRSLIALVLFAAGIGGFIWLQHEGGPVQPSFPAGGASPIVSAANAVLENLTPDQRKKAVFPFDSAERFNFNFVPKMRAGVVWEELNEAQRQQVVTLLQTVLSEQGYRKSREIMALESVLKELEGRAAADRYRHPELYYLAIFGPPSDTLPWSWRFEGHHLSLSFSSVGDHLAVTPAFMGSNPGEVPKGAEKGKRILHMEEDIARQLMALLSPAQLKKTIISERAPQEIITGNNRELSLKEFQGLPYTEMTEEQRQLLLQLIRVYLDNMKARIAQHQWQRIESAGLDKLFFAWAGSLDKGIGSYYRIHGPAFLVEFDNTQNEANHIHTVWRDPTNDFGSDLLREHYENSDHHKH